MKVLFAPWRMEFILGEKERGCVFCKRSQRRQDTKDYILYRGRWNFVILNKFPYNNGHLMVIPYRHLSKIQELEQEEAGEMFSIIRQATTVLEKGMRPDGFNIGMNLGKPAGAGIEDHIHFHVVPRWTADTNFWPVIAETKSMPEHLKKTYDRLKKIWR